MRSGSDETPRDPERYTRDDLRQVQVEALVPVLVLQYAAAVLVAFLPLGLSQDHRAALFLGLVGLTLAAASAHRVGSTFAAGLLTGCDACCWLVGLWLFPSVVMAAAGVLPVGIASALFGARGALALAALVSVGLGGAAWAGALAPGARGRSVCS